MGLVCNIAEWYSCIKISYLFTFIENWHRWNPHENNHMIWKQVNVVKEVCFFINVINVVTSVILSSKYCNKMSVRVLFSPQVNHNVCWIIYVSCVSSQS